MYYLPTERGFAAGYNQVTTTMTFTKLEETDEKIAIRVTAVYATDDTGSQAFRQAVAGWTCLGHKHLHHHNGAGGRRLAVCTV